MPTVASLLAGAWIIVVDPSTPFIQPSAGGKGFPARLSNARWPTLGQGPFTVFFDSAFSRNWEGGATLVKPSGAIVLIPSDDLLYGIDPIAGALTPSHEFVAYTFAAGALDEQGTWEIFLTSPREAGGTGQGVINAGSGAGTFLVVRA